MNSSQRETLAEIHGFLKAFEWVNGKTNHDYSFTIEYYTKESDDAGALVQSHFSRWNGATLLHTPVDNWRLLLHTTLIRWSLAYLHDPAMFGRLVDKNGAFALSHKLFHDNFAGEFIAKVESLSSVIRAYSIRIETQQFYACDSTDILLELRDLWLFLHFDVCD